MYRLRTSNVPKDLLQVTRLAVKFYTDNFIKKSTRLRIEEILVAFRSYSDDIIAYLDYEDNERRLPVEYKVLFKSTMSDITIRDYLITLFHELTHMNQYATGRLSERGSYSLWDGKPVYYDKLDYWQFPWEIDANGMEISAYARFADAYPALELKQYRPTQMGRHKTNWKSFEKQAVRIAAKSMT